MMHIVVKSEDFNPQYFVDGIKALLAQDALNDYHYQIPDYQYNAIMAVVDSLE